ncbi:hypothetical protein M404DRAFT_1006793 [Pisolithus tinctorius Marx 270]|uniref:Uncharacterized protein n=1 Tax=Pisolithus tinctorius Marx 270 TaxID=870435 RepID=A0A0C3N5R3_PISTI|nr:hypothetical protein M404DRAFT_1006793 [Pisolithus tinctorius Marx 270]
MCGACPQDVNLASGLGNHKVRIRITTKSISGGIAVLWLILITLAMSDNPSGATIPDVDRVAGDSCSATSSEPKGY